MDAIRGADFQFHAAIRFLGHFVNGRGAEILAGIAVLFDALCCANVCIRDAKMAWLIFLMPRPGVIHILRARRARASDRPIRARR